jgi:hypothetical protein
MRWKGCVTSLFLFFSALFVSNLPTYAQQNTADVVGTVTDATGSVLPAATVTITNAGTNVSQATQTNGTGDYTFTLLQVGTYTVKVEAQGFKTFTAGNLTLSSGDRTRLDAKMEVGASSQTVEVSGAVAPALQTDSSNLGSLVTSTAVEDVPLNGRNVVRLVQLAPGVTEGSTGSIANGTHPDDRRQTAAFSVNGQVDSQNNNLIDGMDNNERIIGTIGVRPSIDAIQEVNVSTNLYTAEVGRTSGGVVDIITKSGTNGLHGTAYEFFRNKVLNASPNWFSPTLPNPPFRQNQFGGSLGGPIKKDKTFFFGDYEGFVSAVGYPLLANVPTYFEELNPGNFSDIPNGHSAYAPVNISALPACAASSTAGNCLSSFGLAYLKMWPKPNQAPSNISQTGAACNPASATHTTCLAQPLNDYASDPMRTQNSKTFDIRIDQHFSDSDTLFARYSFNNVDTFTPPNFPSVSVGGVTLNPGIGTSFASINGFPGNAYEREQSLAIGYVHVFNSNLVLNLKANYLRSKDDSYGINNGKAINTLLGWPCNAVTCINAPQYLVTLGLMDATFATPAANSFTAPLTYGPASGGSLGDSFYVPLLQYDNTFQYAGTLTMTKGAQSIKIGLGLIRRRATIIQSTGAFGTSAFTGYYTGNPIADSLEGLTTSITRSVSLTAPGFRTWEPSGFVQDDWRAKHWLTLNLGVRYDIFTPYTDIHDAFSNYDPYNGLIVSPGLPGPQNTTKTDGVKTNYLDIAPRFGFAATLPHNTVVRGGFGISYFPTNYQSQYYMKNAPFNYSASCGMVLAAGATSCAPCPATAAGCSTFVGGTFFQNTATATPVAAGGYLPSTAPAYSGTGGAWLPNGLPNPVFNVALATNTANYPSNGAVAAIPFNFPDGYLDQANLLVQKEYKGNVFTAGWVGEFGHHLGSAFAINSFANYQQQVANARPLVVEGFPWWAGTAVTEEGNYGASAYDALQTSFQRRLSSGLTVNLSYTWAHALALSNAACTPYASLGYPCFYDVPGKTSVSGTTLTGEDQENSNQKYGWGNSGQDVHDRVTWTANYQIPFGKSLTGVEGALLKGWAMNTAGSWQTGIPFSVSLASGVGIAGTGFTSTNPDQIGTGRLSNPTKANWFNQASFIAQTPGTIGNERPNQLFGPRLTRTDFSIFKDFAVTERVKMQFRTEIFNLFNHAEFNTPAATLNRTGVGQITSLSNNSIPRQIQFAFKFTF